MFKFEEVENLGVFLITPSVICDARGKFVKKFHKSSFLQNKIGLKVQEEMVSISKKAVLRGLHFQRKNPQAKLINVLKGSIYDVVVDLRLGSLNYGKYFSVVLSSENNLMIFIPEGFAHGFLSLEDDTIVNYMCSTEYEPEYDTGVIYDDSDLNIQWPRLDMDYIISDKDKTLPKFKDFPGFNLGIYEE